MWTCSELVLWNSMRRYSRCFAGISRLHRSRTRIGGSHACWIRRAMRSLPAVPVCGIVPVPQIFSYESSCIVIQETSGASTDDAAGLRPAGKQLAKTLAQRGVFLDVSHLSAKGFWDLAECIDTPILATHSNSRKICNHPRNLTDEQFCEMIRRGGLVGINFYVPFVTYRRTATCDMVVRHIEHFCELGGAHNLCIGADWDGCDRFPKGISDMTGIALLAEALARRNYSEQQIAGFLYDNAARFVQTNF